ncbi:hypothetical protein ACFRNT_07920 [Streptomyces sp. NPDC056697]|uniref:hypothetical protein n=1 Tax=Streptomyces sp. NPDC056697 TaxID=3345915 RepID=UPI0036BB5CF2
MAINPQEVEDMTHAIAWIFKTLLRLLLPPSGRHRAVGTANGRPAVEHWKAPATRAARERRSKGRPYTELVCVPHGTVMTR